MGLDGMAWVGKGRGGMGLVKGVSKPLSAEYMRDPKAHAEMIEFPSPNDQCRR